MGFFDQQKSTIKPTFPKEKYGGVTKMRQGLKALTLVHTAIVQATNNRAGDSKNTGDRGSNQNLFITINNKIKIK